MDQKRRKQPFLILLLVLAFHAVSFLLSVPKSSSIKISQKTQEIKIRLLKEFFKKTEEKKQIVESEAKESQDNFEAKFMSDKNRKTIVETKARKVASFKKNSSSETQHKLQSKNKSLKLSDLAFTPVKEGAQARQKPVERDVASTSDYLENIKLGDITSLNTQEFKFYGFYHRIKLKLEQFWGRSLQEKSQAIFKSGRRLASDDDYMTSLQVTINQKGEITKVRILGTSGVRELDDAAVESFNEAGPFPNPPKDLLKNGYATIEWGFVVKS